MSFVIKVENVSKVYQLGTIGTGTLSHDLNRWWAKIRGKEDPMLKVGMENTIDSVEKKGSVWALKEINFEVDNGEAIGIIGKNGAGKSTLLKILSKVTAPTTGQIKIKGRIASLLEVGTGFHPELTGKENIFLNGAILGMTKSEIHGKLDEIIDFSGVEKYIDTPVKRYSSGMYVRLAFAIAAHLEPEIMIVDEVLAVGDAEFQKKCLGKMNDVAKGGRTVLFVSHNMTAIQGLCNKAIFIHNGKIVDYSDVNSVINKYINYDSSNALKCNLEFSEIDKGNKYIKLKSFEITALNDDEIITIDSGVRIEWSFICLQPKLSLGFTLYLSNSYGIELFESGDTITTNKDSQVGEYTISVEIPAHLLNSDRYHARIVFGESQRFVLASYGDILSFDVEHTATGRGNNFSKALGVIRPLLNWKSQFIKETKV